jgi:hypothetical protein
VYERERLQYAEKKMYGKRTKDREESRHKKQSEGMSIQTIGGESAIAPEIRSGLRVLGIVLKGSEFD